MFAGSQAKLANSGPRKLLALGKPVDEIRRIHLDCGRMMFDKRTDQVGIRGSRSAATVRALSAKDRVFGKGVYTRYFPAPARLPTRADQSRCRHMRLPLPTLSKEDS